ncbi:Vancomycin B-type resistance protein VanW [bacterium HR16]|nr:Vancomycin B-type resistance protein VanW [bacterium HR16]
METKLLKRDENRSKGFRIGTRHMLLLFVMGVAVLAGAASFQLQQEEDHFPPGWRVAGINLSGMSLAAARQQMEQVAQAWNRTSLTVEARTPDGITHWRGQVTREQLGASLDADATLQRAWQQVKQYPPLARMVLAWVRRQAGKEIAPVVRVDDSQLQAWLRSCRKQVETSPRNARIRYISAGRWEVLPEQPGLRLTADAAQRLMEALQLSETTCVLPLEETPPRITRQHLQSIDSEWTIVVTHYSERERNRSYNIRKAAESINGTVLLPGDEFSYNRVVGPRTLKEGFRRAPVIIKGELVPGDGGGVCQVSTTVYMAALQAGLRIVQRSHHAFPIHYAPPGMDATVVYGAIDLRFRNDTPSPIALVAEAKRGRMTVRVLGSSVCKREVKIQRITHAVLPAPVKTFPSATLPAGVRKVVNKGQRGWRVSVYRVITEPGKPPVREKVTTDYYRPQARVVLIGQGQPQQKTPPSSPIPSVPSVEEQL